MSLLTTDVSDPLGTKVATESFGKASVVNQIDDTAGTIYQIEVNNSGGAAVFLKLWEGVSQAPTVGSDAPAHIFRCLVWQVGEHIDAWRLGIYDGVVGSGG